MNKLFYLEGLRGVAALIVVLGHFLLAFYPAFFTGVGDGFSTKISATPLNILYDGNLSVCIFFILSGYVLSYKFIITKDYKTIESSAGKRYIRLLIPVLFSIVLAYFLMKISAFYNLETGVITASYWLSGYVFEPSFLGMLKHAFYGVFVLGEAHYNPVLWTITYEFLGSFLIFGILLIFGRMKNRFFIYLIILVLLINTYYAAFILGLMLCDFKNSGYSLSDKLNNKVTVIISLTIGLIFGSYPLRNVTDTIYESMRLEFIVDPTLNAQLYHVFGGFFIMVALIYSQTLQKLFSTRLMRFFGNISFSIYIIHALVIFSFSSFIFPIILNYFVYSVAFIITFVLSMILIILISYVSYRYIDLSGIKLAKYVYDKFLSSKEEVER